MGGGAGAGGRLPSQAPARPAPAALVTRSLCASFAQSLSPGPGQSAGHRALGAGASITRSSWLHVGPRLVPGGSSLRMSVVFLSLCCLWGN